MIIIGIIGDPNAPGYKRKVDLLIKHSDSQLKFKKYNPSDRYNAVILRSIPELLAYKNDNFFYMTGDNNLTYPYEWQKKLYSLIYRVKNSYIDFALRKKISRAKGVILNSELQKKEMLKFNKKVIYKVDPITDSLLINKEPIFTDYGKIRLGIECGGLNVHTILLNKNFCNAIKLMKNIELHIVIDNIKLQVSYRIRDVFRELKTKFKDKVFLYPFNLENYKKLMRSINISVIPVDHNCLFSSTKSHNRALLMIANNIPVVCTPTNSHVNYLSGLQSCRFARSVDEWINGINDLYTLLKKDGFPNEESKKIIINNDPINYVNTIKEFIVDNI